MLSNLGTLSLFIWLVLYKQGSASSFEAAPLQPANPRQHPYTIEKHLQPQLPIRTQPEHQVQLSRKIVTKRKHLTNTLISYWPISQYIPML